VPRRSGPYGDRPGSHALPEGESVDAYLPEWSEPPWSDGEGEFTVPEGPPHTEHPNGRPPQSYGSAAGGRRP
jgi:hypothetical protein